MSDKSDTTTAQNESEIRARFEEAGQSHVLQYLPSLSSTDRTQLMQQLQSIEVEKLSSFLESALEEQQQQSHDDDDDDEKNKIRPFSKPVGRTSDKNLVSSSRTIGLQSIARGEVAALVLSGGQGTRLGFDGPKGMYNIQMKSGRTLFQLVAERIQRLCHLAAAAAAGAAGEENDKDVVVVAADDDDGIVIPWYIMTSPLNHDETVSYFESESYFGLPKSSVNFFEQGMLPCLTSEGKIIMETQSKVAMAPDGNGGIYPSLYKSGMLSDMKDRGVKYIHVFSIDNALVKPADPVFMGYCLSQNADCGNKVLWKAGAHEKVGVVAERNGKPCIVEYSDMDASMAEKVDENGRLVFGAGNICNHFYTLDFIEKVVVPNMSNMYHVAKKKIPYFDEVSKKTVKPTENNGIKLESFIFDVFPLSVNMAMLDVSREEEFAPVKNAPGSSSDSPDTARSMISSLSKQWVKEAGGVLIDDIDGDDMCEVSPLVSYDGEGLKELVENKTIQCPFSL
mmetsp:Transcript_48411/g.73133  ORF Transcript_48411/g.73133 Transcript_48411/m.73133 type:complete len:508 (+) Transcript_48411:124-1647(+)